MIGVFQTHANNKSTGTALLVFENKTIGKVYFSDGVPVSARLQNKEGQEAIAEMQQLGLQSSVLHPNIDAVQSNAALQLENQPASSRQQTQRPVAQNTSEQLPATQTIAALSGDQKQEITTQLAHYIGPVAQIMMNQLNPSSGISDTIAGLVKNIHDPTEAKSFIAAVEQILKRNA